MVNSTNTVMLKLSLLFSCLSLTWAARAEWWKYLTKKGDRDRFYRHHVQNKTLEFEGVDYYHVIDDCLTQELGVEGRAEIQKSKIDVRKVGRMLKDPADDLVFLVAVENAITPEHANAVRALAKCVRLAIPKLYEVRAMYREEELDFDPGLGGNCPTHLAPLVGVFFPSVVKEMQATLEFAYDAANWADWHMDNGVPPQRSLPSPDMVGFRASEHLTYNEFKEGTWVPYPHTHDMTNEEDKVSDGASCYSSILFHRFECTQGRIRHFLYNEFCLCGSTRIRWRLLLHSRPNGG